MEIEQKKREQRIIHCKQNIKPFGSNVGLIHREPEFTNLAPGAYKPRYSIVTKY